MFNHKVTTILITRANIRAAVFSGSGKLIREEGVWEWNENTLPGILKKIVQNGLDRARVVFGEEFCYVAALKSADKSREAVLKETRESMPDDIRSAWDYRAEKTPDFPFQVAAIQPKFFDFFTKYLDASGLQVESMEPESIAVARMLPSSGIHLFLVRNGKALLGASKDGVVVATFLDKEEEIMENFQNFLSFVRKKCGASPEKIYTGETVTEQAAQFFRQYGVTLEKAVTDPLAGAAIKKDISGEDSRVLNIDSHGPAPAAGNLEKKSAGVSKREKILAALFILMVFCATALLLIKYWKK